MSISAIDALMYTSRVPEPPTLDQDQSIKDVRNRLAPIIEAARYFGRVTFMTNRGSRVASIVSVEVGELVDEIGMDEAAQILRASRP